MNNPNGAANAFLVYINKTKLLYKISFWYGIFCLIFSAISIVVVFKVLYPAQGIELSKVLSTNSITSDLLWFSNLLKDPIYYGIIAFIPLLVLRGKAKINRLTDTAATIVSISACLGVIFLIVGIVSGITTGSALNGFSVASSLKGFTYPILPIASLLACILFVVSYVNEKIDGMPRKYIQIILPSLALLIIILDIVTSFFHIY